MILDKAVKAYYPTTWRGHKEMRWDHWSRKKVEMASEWFRVHTAVSIIGLPFRAEELTLANPGLVLVTVDRPEPRRWIQERLPSIVVPLPARGYGPGQSP